MEKIVVRSPMVPETGGPFSLAVRHRDLVYVSGLPPFEEDFCRLLREARASGGPLPRYDRKPIEDETRIVMNHLRWLLEAAGSSMAHLLKVTVWLREQKEQGRFDAVYARCFKGKETLPARTRMQAGATPFDCGLEIDAIGYVPGMPGDA